MPTILGQIDLKDALIVTWWRDNTTPDLAGYIVEYTIPDWDEGADPVAQGAARAAPLARPVALVGAHSAWAGC